MLQPGKLFGGVTSSAVPSSALRDLPLPAYERLLVLIVPLLGFVLEEAEILPAHKHAAILSVRSVFKTFYVHSSNGNVFTLNNCLPVSQSTATSVDFLHTQLNSSVSVSYLIALTTVFNL